MKLNMSRETDARRWAEEFIKSVNRNRIVVDEEFIATWFANAMQAMYDVTVERMSKKSTERDDIDGCR